MAGRASESIATGWLGNLPLATSSFIGRERALAEVDDLLGRTRLLTLTGAGGSGKTRLALRYAEAHTARYRDGAWLIELAALTDGGLVAQTAAGALRIREPATGTLLEAIAEHLAPRHVLLIVDNCEHLIDAAAGLVDAILRACADVTVLATSRMPLTLPGETVYRVPSLALPDRRRQPPLTRLRGYEAVQLFVERASAALPAFAVTEANAAAVLEICRRLDGIPLALELAAAQVSTLSVEQIAARLDDRFRLLTSGSRATLPRHQTLRALIDWSYDLLTEPERTVFDRLSVFAGGFTLEAAETVCADAGARAAPSGPPGGVSLDSADIDELLKRLVDASLVVREQREDGPRFHLLETLREHGAVGLRVRGEAATLRERHRDYYLALAERAEPGLLGPRSKAWMDTLEQEQENLRHALATRTADVEGSEAELRLAAALMRFWAMRGHLSEGRTWLAAVLHRSAGVDSPARVRALLAAGHLARIQGDYERAARTLDEGLTTARRLGDDGAAAAALNNLGLVALDHGDTEPAEAHFRAALAIRRRLGDERGIAAVLHNLALVARRTGRAGDAAALLEQAIAALAATTGRHGVAEAGIALAGLLRETGDPTGAEHQYREALAVLWDERNLRLVPACLEGLAAGAVAADAARAVRLLGGADALRDDLGLPLSPLERPAVEATRAAALTALGEGAFATEWREGRALTPDDAVALALAVPPATAPAADPPEPPEPPALRLVPPSGQRPAGLTAREVDVLRQLSRGLTNNEIAEQLVVSPRTVNAHLASIYAKTGVSSRAAATRWALEHGLA